jgi:hypothetical protein
MAALVAAIYVFNDSKDVDPRDKPGDDDLAQTVCGKFSAP